MYGNEREIFSAWTMLNARNWTIIKNDIRAEIQREEVERQRRDAEQRELEARAAAEQQAAAGRRRTADELEKQAEEEAQARAKSRPADSYCVFSCDPLEENGRQALRGQLRAMFTTPIIVMNFRKTNGARAKIIGMDVYEMQFEASIELPLGFVPPPKGFWDELNRGPEGQMKFTELQQMMTLREKLSGNKWWEPASFVASGTVWFRKTEKGWQGVDGRVY